MKPKILYAMHVDWAWIKQRPHFLAEELSTDFDVLPFYIPNYRKSELARNATTLRALPIATLPFSRFAIIRIINRYLRTAHLYAALFLFRPSVVWFTFPTMLPEFWLGLLRRVTVIYDCMDDATAFRLSGETKAEILQKENILLGLSDLVFVSSDRLREKMVARGVNGHNIVLIRNAFGGEIMRYSSQTKNSEEVSVEVYRILYFGTIGDYFDFGALLYVLNRINSVEFHIYGPIVTEVPGAARIHFHGPIGHAALMREAGNYDACIMPFIVNELILSVDPVKLYEYVNLGKPIFCPYYGEIERFRRFVTFYQNYDELAESIEVARRGCQSEYDEGGRAAFLEENSWGRRALVVADAIHRTVHAEGRL